MKAMGFTKFGSPEVLEPMELATPQAGEGEVRVRVKAAGVQPVDCAIRTGFRPQGVPVSLPHVTGGEFAGIVDQTGSGVTAFAPGDEVLGFRMQYTYAEYVVVPQEQLVRKPTAMPWEAAGGLSGAGQTALTALEELAGELGVRWIRSRRSAQRLAELVELYSLGQLRIHIRRAFPLSQAAEAHREMETGHGRGKIVLTLED
ncbi:NADP-dependent oxidoreductase [Paenibacillus chitinolyticus]|uniref:NADP-dependent oxidoreductase n=1 Tax=Paenibacillus chitinolyticus TaxID=79263 RepID=UPI00366C75A7